MRGLKSWGGVTIVNGLSYVYVIPVQSCLSQRVRDETNSVSERSEVLGQSFFLPRQLFRSICIAETILMPESDTWPGQTQSWNRQSYFYFQFAGLVSRQANKNPGRGA